jgi:hypothetical protein
MDAQDRRDRAELIERDAKLKVMEKLAEQTEAMSEQTETLNKLIEAQKK